MLNLLINDSDFRKSSKLSKFTNTLNYSDWLKKQDYCKERQKHLFKLYEQFNTRPSQLQFFLVKLKSR